ncbi:MAG: AAC(3) family N-acetyltransferase [Carnobacterium sp.]
MELFTDNFLTIGTDFEAENKCINGTVGNSKVKLFNQKKAVDFAESWLKNHSQK